jgi:hypothetical protein
MARAQLPTLDQLARLDLEALKQTWVSVFSGPPPSRMPRDFLIKLLAQGLQERGSGGIPKALERAIAKPSNGGEDGPSSDEPSGKLTLGARLVRSWGHMNHEVMVIENGFAYRGKAYRSLSEVAREITGARWSGPRFFGLKRGGRTERPMEEQA